MKNKKLNYRKGKNIKTLDGQKINKSNVISFVDSIFTPKEKKRLIELSKWAKNLNKDLDQYNNEKGILDCNPRFKFIQICFCINLTGFWSFLTKI